MADNPDTGAGLSENDGAAALARLRKAPQQDKPEEKAQTDSAPEADTSDFDDVLESAPDESEQSGSDGETSDQENSRDDTERPADDAEVFIEVKIDGKTQRITAKEASEGYLRRSDHTKRLMDIAKQRDALEAREKEVLPRLQQLVASLESQAEKDPDWVKLASELDPWEFNKRKVEWDAKSAAKQAARLQLEAAHRQQMADAQAQAKKALMSDDFEKSWATEDGLKKGIEQIAAWAVEQGFDQQILANIVDPKVIKIMEKARRYDDLQSKSLKARVELKGKPKPLKPGAKPVQTSAARDKQSALNRFHQTKTQADALAALAKVRAA